MPQLVAAAAGSAALSLTAGASLATSAAAFSAATAIGSAVGSVALSVALSAAASALSGALAPKQGLGAAEAISDGLRLPISQAIPQQRLVLGRATTSGAVFFRRSDPPYFWLGLLLAAHECGPMETLWINGVECALDGDGLAKSTPFYDGSTTYIEASYGSGADDQAIDPIIARDFPSMPTTFRHRGHTRLVIKAHYGANDTVHNEVYGTNGGLNPLVRFQGGKVYDPRKPGQDVSDPTTWTWTDTASLCIVRYLLHPWPDMRLVEPGQINWDLVAAAAEVDERWKARGDGTTERNHTLNGVILAGEDPFTVVRDMLVGNDGLLILDRGKYHLVSGGPVAPIGTLHQGMLAGGFEYQSEAADRDLINTLSIEIVDPSRDYQVVVGPVLKRTDLIAADGRALEATRSYRFIEGHQRGQRIGDREIRRSRVGRSFSAPFTSEAADYKAGDVVRIDFRDFPHVNGIYQIVSGDEDAATGTVPLSLIGWDDEVYTGYNAATDEQPFTLDADVLAA